jgi:Fe-S cluster assembly iron-binding protein IscA
MIQVSDAAAAKFREIAAQTDKPEDQMLRISYGGAG